MTQASQAHVVESPLQGAHPHSPAAFPSVSPIKLEDHVLAVENISKRYPIAQNVWSTMRGWVRRRIRKTPQQKNDPSIAHTPYPASQNSEDPSIPVIHALNGVSLVVKRGRTLAVVGESGCGKSTLARQLTMIETPDSGTIWINDRQLVPGDQALYKSLRRHVQMVFQNPYASLNPRKTIGATLSEPLEINEPLNAQQRAWRVAEILQTVGLLPEHAKRYPHMFSGGQRQRIAIARAMILGPDLLVADEPVSALDVSIQAQILNLLMDLQAQFLTSMVFISHNLSVVEHIADDVMVMYLGRVVEIGDKTTIFSQPLHPYTRMLIAATPALHAENRRIRIPIQGELPSPLTPPSGCAFHPRCPYATELCRQETPQLRSVESREVACHWAETIG